MIEPPRILADWLSGAILDYQGANQGINTQIANVPRDPGDPAPADLAAVLDETRDQRVARRQLPEDFPSPAYVVLLPDDIELMGEVHTVDRDSNAFQVLIAEAVQGATDTQKATQDTYYRRRAALKSLKQLHRNENVAARTRNGICLWTCRSMRLVRLDVEFGHAHLGAGVVLTYGLRDLQP